jgi:3-oxosteroid 1-dehydrogenase
LGRSPKTLGPIDTPPFYATAMYPGAFLGAGPVRNAKAQIVDVYGSPVPRLYSAGELGSWLTFVYSTGAFLAECVIAGRIAGKNAAAEKPWGTAT